MYSPTACELSSLYYEAIQVNLVQAGYYRIASNSTIDTYGYFYNDTFIPFAPNLNELSRDDDSCDDYQFKLSTVLHVNTTYILVVTTYDSNVTGDFSIIVSGPNNVSLNRISEYLYYLVNNQHKMHKMLVNSIFTVNLQKGLQIPLLNRESHFQRLFPHSLALMLPLYFILRNV
jgi:hypothetical protein